MAAGSIVIVYRRNFGPDGQGTAVVPVPYYQHPDGSLSPIVHVPEFEKVLADSGDQVDYANAQLGMLATMEEVLEGLSTSGTNVLQLLNAMPGSKGKHAASTSFPVTLATDEDLAVHPAVGVTFPVSITGQSGNVAVAGTVAISNLPATQQVAGSVAVSKFPVTQPISGTVGINNFPATQQIAGAVSISNLPTTQPVSGTVGISNFPATQPVSGTVAISGTVPVSGFPTTQQVTGTVGVNNFPTSFNVGNFPATQQVGGTVGVNNFPATQQVSGSLSVSGATSSYRFVSAANTTAVQIKAGAGKLYDFLLLNTINPGLFTTTLALFAANRYVKFYDKATAPTITDTPILTVPVATGGSTPWTSSAGRPFANGLWIRITQGLADSDNTAPAAGEVIVQALYS